uniref:AB hydrolase-1 domain-containing protein n=1 Tax=Davidia involucrata TaxID=16924 RepID=A0A5B6Z1K1_DAVIN
MPRGIVFILPLFFFLLALLLLSVLGDTNHHDQRIRSVGRKSKTCQKPHFVLVHGYGGGAWSWYKIWCLLETSGYKVTCLDLKGAGIDSTDSSTVHTFDSYNEPLINFLANLTENEKVILVGHSAGGLSVTDASQRFSKKIQVAIYVAAVMLKHGYVTDQDKKNGVPDFVLGDSNSTTGGNTSRPHITPQEDAVLASMLSRPVPLEAILEARFRGNGAENVRRVYMKTMYDQVLKPEQQEAMIKKWPLAPSDVVVLKSDHYLPFSDPFVLSGSLVQVAASIECN